MNGPMKRKAFTASELVVVTVVAVLAIGLLLPAVLHSQENQRRDSCIHKLKQIGLALHNHHDAHRRFPALSTEPYPQGVGSTPLSTVKNTASWASLWRCRNRLPLSWRCSLCQPSSFGGGCRSSILESLS